MMTETLPACLVKIRTVVRRSLPENTVVGTAQRRWTQHWKEYTTQANRKIPDLRIEDAGETIYLNQLSPGCQACKQGTWDCIFTTMRCNLDCGFCCSPHAIAKDFAGSAFGSSPEQIINNHSKSTITGISFSGGEPFVDKPRLFSWINAFGEQTSRKYMWLYTNGILVTQDDLQHLCKLGINEIRFNLAATGYTNTKILKVLTWAVQLIPNVTVEIPAIPGHASKLLDSLAKWASLGIKYLNLHELMYEQGTNAARLAGSRCTLILDDGHRTDVNPESRLVSLEVMKKVQKENLPLAVNYCSMQSKIRQLRGRRRSLAPILREPYEKLLEEEFYECYGVYRNEEDYFFIHPDALHRVRRTHSDYHYVRLARTAPLSIKDKGQWVVFEPIS